MGQAQVTVVVVPRERFSEAPRSLDSILEHTDQPYELLYVDGRSPRAVRAEIEDRRREHGFDVVRSDSYLSPNQARNLALARVATPYVAFVDNDLIVTPGWLTGLVACAEETGAWMVGPLYLEGDPVDRVVHMAGGDLAFDGPHGRRRFTTEHRHQGSVLDDLEAPLVREACGFVEFHCALVRTARLRELGGLDEGLLNTREHLDLSLAVAAAGGEVWFEPASVVTYSTPPPLPLRDVPYFWLRWSDAWSEASMARFSEKHGIDPDYRHRISIMRARRQIAFHPVRAAAERALGRQAGRVVGKVLRTVEPPVHRLAFRRLRPSPAEHDGAQASSER